PQLVDALSTLSPQTSRIPYYSSVLGDRVEGARLDAEFWGRNLRDPVLFSTATEKLSQDGYNIFLEISPHPLLTTAVREVLEHCSRPGLAVASLRRDEPDARALLVAMSALHCSGYAIDFRKLHPEPRRVTPLPLYAWQRRRFWLEPKAHVDQ